MLLPEAERREIRELQDDLIRLAEAAGYEDDMPVSVDIPADVTIGALRRFIYPHFLPTIRAVRDRLREGR